MADREKVIDILGACGTDDCDNCPLNGDERCSGFVDVPAKVLMDALALLEEQEPAKAKILKQGMTINYGKFVYAGLCPACNSLLLRRWVACPTCGKAVKWDD